MDYLLTGVLTGLALSILVGPILFAIIQESIQNGFRAGIIIASGVWFSDFLFISSSYFGMSYLMQIVDMPHFKSILGIGGGFILIFFGLGTILTSSTNTSVQVIENRNQNILHKGSSFMKGFLINTINPFTLFFWMGVTTTTVINNQLTNYDTLSFFIGILATVILTDTIKIYLAKRIRHKLKSNIILLLRKISGGILMLIGLLFLSHAFLAL